MFRVETATGAKWENWSGSAGCTPRQMATPANEAELADLVRQAAEAGENVRVVGSGHSFTPLVPTSGLLLSLDGMQGAIAIDREAARATVWAGTKLKALGELLYAEGLAQENLGDINVQSVAGAISTGTHGTGAKLGVIASQVRELTLLTAFGETITCSETHEREVFKAAQVSLGALGVITRVKLQLLPAYNLHQRKGTARLDAVLADLARLKSANRNFEFFWFPHTDRVQTKCLNVVDSAPQGSSLAKVVDELVMENGAFWLLSEVARAVPAFARPVSQLAASALSSSEEINPSHRIFATQRLVKFQEMEYCLPAENLEAAIEEMRETIQRENFEVHFPIEVRFGAGDDIFLSPAHGRNTAYVAVHMYRGMPYRAYFDAMETIFRKYAGRPHWGKLHTLGARELAPLYPKWENFQAVRRELDPKGVFLNDHLKKLFTQA